MSFSFVGLKLAYMEEKMETDYKDNFYPLD